MTHPAVTELVRYSAKSLATADVRAVEAHLKTCTLCRNYIKLNRSIERQLRRSLRAQQRDSSSRTESSRLETHKTILDLIDLQREREQDPEIGREMERYILLETLNRIESESYTR